MVNDLTIVVCSCDSYEDTWEPFRHCIEKYWRGHPEIIYKTETKDNPYYRTVRTNYPIEQWTRGVREALDYVETSKVLLMMDDCFIRRPVDEERLEDALHLLQGNVANVNLERSWDPEDTHYHTGIKRRHHGSQFEVSIMCGLWQKECLYNVMSIDGSPWDVEQAQNNCNYDYLINAGEDIIDFGYVRTWVPFGISRGKWCLEILPFFEHERITIDYTKRGIW